jgi:hypothetical protein
MTDASVNTASTNHSPIISANKKPNISVDNQSNPSSLPPPPSTKTPIIKKIEYAYGENEYTRKIKARYPNYDAAAGR